MKMKYGIGQIRALPCIYVPELPVPDNEGNRALLKLYPLINAGNTPFLQAVSGTFMAAVNNFADIFIFGQPDRRLADYLVVRTEDNILETTHKTRARDLESSRGYFTFTQRNGAGKAHQ